MTAEEIKNLIDQKIAGQGSMVDISGALPTILKEIVDVAADAQADALKPIRWVEALDDGMSVNALNEAGFTYEEVLAASQGKRTGVYQVSDGRFYFISQAFVIDEKNYQISFYGCSYEEDGTMYELEGNRIVRWGDNVTVTNASI